MNNSEKIALIAERLGIDFDAIEAEQKAALERGAEIEAGLAADRAVEETEDEKEPEPQPA